MQLCLGPERFNSCDVGPAPQRHAVFDVDRRPTASASVAAFFESIAQTGGARAVRLRVSGRRSVYDLFYGSDLRSRAVPAVAYAVDTRDAAYVGTIQLPRRSVSVGPCTIACCIHSVVIEYKNHDALDCRRENLAAIGYLAAGNHRRQASCQRGPWQAPVLTTTEVDLLRTSGRKGPGADSYRLTDVDIDRNSGLPPQRKVLQLQAEDTRPRLVNGVKPVGPAACTIDRCLNSVMIEHNACVAIGYLPTGNHSTQASCARGKWKVPLFSSTEVDALRASGRTTDREMLVRHAGAREVINAFDRSCEARGSGPPAEPVTRSGPPTNVAGLQVDVVSAKPHPLIFKLEPFRSSLTYKANWLRAAEPLVAERGCKSLTVLNVGGNRCIYTPRTWQDVLTIVDEICAAALPEEQSAEHPEAARVYRCVPTRPDQYVKPQQWRAIIARYPNEWLPPMVLTPSPTQPRYIWQASERVQLDVTHWQLEWTGVSELLTLAESVPRQRMTIANRAPGDQPTAGVAKK